MSDIKSMDLAFHLEFHFNIQFNMNVFKRKVIFKKVDWQQYVIVTVETIYLLDFIISALNFVITAVFVYMILLFSYRIVTY